MPDSLPAGAPPKLLYVSTLDHIIRVMLPHLDAARAAGFRVEVACQVTRFRDDVLPHVDALHDLPMQRFPLHPANLAALRQLTRLIREGGYTIVHAHNPTGGFVGRLAATRAGTPCVRAYTAHGFHFHRHGGRLTNAAYRVIERFAGHRLSDGVLVINREDYEAALAYDVVPQDRLFMTGGVGVSATDLFDPARVSPEERRALRREIGAEDEAIPVLSVIGEMLPRKRQEDAIAAMVPIRRAQPHALLVLVGDGVKLEERKALATQLGVADACRFLGFRRDVPRILAASDVFLFPSQQEGLPCAVQEALSMGVPTVATDVRGCTDLIDESCGRLVPLGDTAALAERALELLVLPADKRRAMGAAGREKMLRQYDRPACVAQWQEVYRVLLERKGIVLLEPSPPGPLPHAVGEGEKEYGVIGLPVSPRASTPPPPQRGGGGRGERASL